MTVRELIESKRSDNFNYCCTLLSYKQMQTFRDSYMPTYEECLNFVKTVISKLFEKAKTLNVDVTAYPENCCYLLNNLNGIPTLMSLFQFNGYAETHIQFLIFLTMRCATILSLESFVIQLTTPSFHT